MAAMLIPTKTWSEITESLMQIRTGVAIPSQSVRVELEAFHYTEKGQLTPLGESVLLQHFVRKEDRAVMTIHQEKLLSLAATQALLQAVWGLKDITVDQAFHAIILAGADWTTLEKTITKFLDVLNAFGVIVYSKRLRKIKPLISPIASANIPEHVFINKDRPFSNDYWMRQIIADCRQSITWIDKYFDKSAFEWIWREAKADNISTVTVISARTDGGIDATTLADYHRLKKELANREITLDWRLLPKTEAHLIHDRWIIDGKDLCYNLPSTSTVRSGQSSELLRSKNHKEVRTLADSLLPLCSVA